MGLEEDTLELVRPEAFLSAAESRGFQGQAHRWGQQATADWEELVGAGRLDLLEVGAPGDSALTKEVSGRGGRALRLGPHNNFDMASPQGRRALLGMLLAARPRHVWFSLPCCRQSVVGAV